ncbi:replication factor C subunit 5 [Toxorhynchites rutilus septentrionalis]|uniref:replication factor C subunit 5 n=1 Tax=Toxorhynchites rutilus septentrionalis TaxID=329112 RepID=UPI002478D2F4|nr:replication factor C subunit 5 [Toxorhynchites rutilus septentrionalis]
MLKDGKSNLPWVEKYRPATLNDLISHEEIISTINKFIQEDQLPHLLFYGPPGTGKTSTILACARQLYKTQSFNQMVLELNASDDRGINIVRGQILNFASTRTIFSGGFKLIILDEADAMTNDAQNALRRIIEKYTDNVRFCIICNYLSKIIPALQSRCTRFRFAPLSPDQILPRLEHVVEAEGIKVSEDGKKALMTLAGGDMRKVLNVLQSTWMAYKNVTEDNVYTCVGHPLKSDITNIVDWLLNADSFKEIYEKIQELKTNKGLALEDILTEIHLYVHRMELPPRVISQLLIKMAAIEERLAAGCVEKPQLAALIAAFNMARDQVIVES